MKTGPRSKDVTSANTLRPRLVLYIYLSACYTYLWLLNDDVVECPIFTGMQRTKMIIFILHPTQQILNMVGWHVVVVSRQQIAFWNPLYRLMRSLCAVLLL